MGLSELLEKAQAKGGIVMDETYIKMCKEAREIQKLWKPSDGDKIYTEYSEKDRKFAQEHWKSNKKGFSSYVTNFEFLNNPNGTYEPYLKENNIWILRQEDLQEIERNCMQKKLKYITQRTLQQYDRFEKWLRCLSFEGLDSNLDLTMLWLMFVMETVFSKCWNSKTESWEVIT